MLDFNILEKKYKDKIEAIESLKDRLVPKLVLIKERRYYEDNALYNSFYFGLALSNIEVERLILYKLVREKTSLDYNNKFYNQYLNYFRLLKYIHSKGHLLTRELTADILINFNNILLQNLDKEEISEYKIDMLDKLVNRIQTTNNSVLLKSSLLYFHIVTGNYFNFSIRESANLFILLSLYKNDYSIGGIFFYEKYLFIKYRDTYNILLEEPNGKNEVLFIQIFLDSIFETLVELDSLLSLQISQ